MGTDKGTLGSRYDLSDAIEQLENDGCVIMQYDTQIKIKLCLSIIKKRVAEIYDMLDLEPLG